MDPGFMLGVCRIPGNLGSRQREPKEQRTADGTLLRRPSQWGVNPPNPPGRDSPPRCARRPAPWLQLLSSGPPGGGFARVRSQPLHTGTLWS